ncbi:MAG: NAD(P)-binding protein, partial [Archaeoglobaceae archaeon]
DRARMKEEEVRAMPDGTRATAPLDALVIGAGFSGLYALHRLRDHFGLSVMVLEMAQDNIQRKLF